MRFVSRLLPFLVPVVLSAQLDNRSFRIQPAMPATKWGATFEALQFLKNNEYFNNINPGETYFGFQVKPQIHYRISNQVTFSTGALLQQNFGDPVFLSKALPIFNFRIVKNNWLYNLGNIQPNIFHNLPEPMLSYENLFTQPTEMGLQAKRTTPKMNYDAWLEWRQYLNPATNRQEMIVFGQSLEERLWRPGSSVLTMPLFATIYHRGGQALNGAGHLATRVNAGGGLRWRNKDTSLLLESLIFEGLDNSPTLTQPYKNGWAAMANLRFRFKKYHQIALSWWYANEFSTTLGNTIFSNANLSNPYLNSGIRRLIMCRYVFSRPIAGNKLWVDFRFEPYYDMDYKKTEFSNGLYFRYVSTLEVKAPKWMSSFQ